MIQDSYPHGAYANGEGVPRNLPLARRFLREYSDGILGEEPAQHLAKFNKLIRAGGHFDVCADKGGSFGRQTNFTCLGLQLERQADDIHRRELAISAASSPSIKSSFLALQSAWQAFHKAYASMDTALCEGGTGYGPVTEDDDLTFTTQWLSEAAEKPRL